MLRVVHNSNFKFVRWWRIAAATTTTLFVAGLAMFFLAGGLQYSIEFTGGTLMQLEFKEPPDVANIRSTLADAGLGSVEIQQYGSNTEYTIRAQDVEHIETQSEGAEGIALQIENALRTAMGADAFTVVYSDAVGPRVGSELRSGAITAVIIASLFTLIYLAIRFDWRFGLAAVLATTQLVFVTFAFVSLMRLEISLTLVAALLTLLGYGVNDTIIIFDRVRENLRKQRKGETLESLVDRSINETLPRSVMTHATTLAATLALLFFAGEVIRPFALVMSFGVFIATFTSMYVASSLLVAIERKWPRKVTEAAGRAVRAGGGASTSRARDTEKLATR